MPVRKMLVTDVTRMSGRRVCIAGLVGSSWDSLACVRPVLLPPGIDEDFLFEDGIPIIRPFAVVKLDFTEACNSIPPHTEDWMIDGRYRQFCRELNLSERHKILSRIATGAVTELFGCPICEGKYVTQGAGQCSLGTIRVRSLHSVRFTRKDESEPRKFDFRLSFTDEANDCHRLAVTDLAFRRYCVHQHASMQCACEEVSSRLTFTLQQADELFFRIGLARGWSEHPERCYLQVTGVYSFPDYLEGACFADFRPIRDWTPDLPGSSRDLPF